MNNIKIFNENSLVIKNNKISNSIWETILETKDIAKFSKPGQFINILPSKNWNKVMRRPMSIAGVKDNKIKILYKVIGDGTRIMSHWVKGDKVDIIGPLGNTWGSYINKKPILIGGGTGIAPILFYYKKIIKSREEPILIIGGKTKSDHFIKHQPENNILLTTDDGSYGIKGNVIDGLKTIYGKYNNQIKVFACGPDPMMKNIKKFTLGKEILCELSLESVMACGIGICQGCSIETKNELLTKNSYREKYKLLCIDGPVINAEEVIFAK